MSNSNFSNKSGDRPYTLMDGELIGTNGGGATLGLPVPLTSKSEVGGIKCSCQLNDWRQVRIGTRGVFFPICLFPRPMSALVSMQNTRGRHCGGNLVQCAVYTTRCGFSVKYRLRIVSRTNESNMFHTVFVIILASVRFLSLDGSECQT